MDEINLAQKMWNDIFKKESLELLLELGEYYDEYTNVEIISLECKFIEGWITIRVGIMLCGELQNLVLGSASDIEDDIYQFNFRDIDDELSRRNIPKDVADMIETRLMYFLDIVFMYITGSQNENIKWS